MCGGKKYMKKSLIWAVAIAIALGLVISSASSMPTEKTTTENEEIIAHFPLHTNY